MKKNTTLLLLCTVLLAMVGCGGSSSVELPEDIITEDAYALTWVDFSSIEPEAGVKMLSGIASDVDDDQGKARLWLSAAGDTVDAFYRERWDAFTEAGGQGMLTVYYCTEEKEKRTFETHTFIKAKKGTKGDDIVEAIESFVDEDMGLAWEKDKDADLELEEVGDDGWFWVTRTKAPEGSPEMPDDGDSEALEVFTDLLDDADGAPIVYAFRMIEPILDTVEKELKDKDKKLDAERKEQLEFAEAIKSYALACSPGSGAWTQSVIHFEGDEDAKAYAEDYNDRMRKFKPRFKRAFMSRDDPPHPDELNSILDKFKADASGETVTSKYEGDMLESLLVLTTAADGKNADSTSPVMMLELDRALVQPNYEQVPGIWSCYEISFDKKILPTTKKE